MYRARIKGLSCEAQRPSFDGPFHSIPGHYLLVRVGENCPPSACDIYKSMTGSDRSLLNLNHALYFILHGLVSGYCNCDFR